MKRILTILLLLAAPLFCHAQEKGDDFGIWSSIDLAGKVNSRFKAGLWIEHRSKTMAKVLDCALLMPYVDYKLDKHWSLNFAAEYIVCTDMHKEFTLRPSVSYKLQSGDMHFAVRVLPIYEKAFGDAPGRWTLRTRAKVGYSIPQTRVAPYASVEIFNKKLYERTRYMVGSTFGFGKRSGLDIYYMCQVWSMKAYPRHILGLGYTLNLF